ncbi:MAG: manganese efflux pump [Alphaproteobacteria bacterium]|nr:manganese efflux pump [Alphaproteobacteria bacterium]
MVEVGVLAVALALDAAAVSAALAAAGTRPRTLAWAALLFGLAQAAMSGAGALGGAWLAEVASAWDHWVAFVLLAAVGGRMLWVGADEADELGAEPSTTVLLGLAVATSVDALAAGVTLPLLGAAVGVAVVVIGVVTTALSVGAAIAGRRAGAHVGPWAIRLAGGVLVGIGLRVLVSHLAGAA